MDINYNLDMERGPFFQLLSFAEAAEIWGIDQSTLRKAVADGRLYPGVDCRKFGKQWVVTVDAMARVFSKTGNMDYSPWSKFLTHLRLARAAKNPSQDFTLQ